MYENENETKNITNNMLKVASTFISNVYNFFVDAF